ncbi:MAG: Sensory/regulatory protein RpfC [Dehalococcoidia bacterium]|nr:Sensory/regulatory protein RpfC [Bacillota bacterium]
MPRLNFTIDSALLRELGERLVGKPYIALAEMVKNSYDADAFEATIEFAPEEDRIEVRDDGHGMTFDEFRDFWMRVGTIHKTKKRVSKCLERPMTGSKGVGRLAVQFLAKNLKIVTVPKEYDSEWLEASVDWEEAVQAGDLVDASVFYTEKTSPPPFEQGTSIVLSGLRDEWSEDEIKGLAGELWWLRPPFRSSSLAAEGRFEINFQSPQREFEEVFEEQIRAIMKIWTARLVGENKGGHVSLSLEFVGEPPQTHTYNVADFPHNDGQFNREKNLNEGDFEIRFFGLRYRQPHGIKVGEAREYFWKYGGVHVYDGGFRLPYYGDPKNDWLLIEFDHAHRKFASELLPKKLQAQYAETERLRYLPTLGRVFGVVNVNTSREPNLQIIITRDRLAETVAFQDLMAMVRYAFDWYAFEEARRVFERKLKEAPVEPTSWKFERVEQVLEHYEPQIPEDVYQDLREKIQEATTAATASQEVALGQMGLLGPLATAGISALAYQHELRKQFSTIESIVERIAEVRTSDASLRRSLESLREDLSSWLERARATNALFDYLADAENTETRRRFRAAEVVEEVQRQTAFLARGIKVDVSEVDERLLLPEASLAEWSAIFQNVFTNAFNAMMDSEGRFLQVSSRSRGKSREILVQDTGLGVDLRDADRLFEPFERGVEISRERRALGYGGTGLGLTIVRLLADKINCKVGFVEPDEGFSTAFSVSWRETK